MKIIIKFPTRNRPDKFFETLRKYKYNLDDQSILFIVSCDLDDATMNNDKIKEQIKYFENVKMYFNDNKSKVDAINANLENVDFDILLLASDDMIPQVQGFDTIIRDQMVKHFPDTDGVLRFFDGYNTDTNTLCILGKKYYDRFGYIYYPEYKSCWCDAEFTKVSQKLKKEAKINQIIIRHEHPDNGWGKYDDIYSLNKKNTIWDSTLYFKRLKYI